MNEADATAWITRLIDYYATLFRLDGWKILWKFDRLETLGNDNVVRADVEITPDRWIAAIRFDLDHIADEEALVTTVRHEMLHILCWPYEQYSKFIERVVASEYENPLEHMRSASAERLVGNLELMLDYGLALTPEKTTRLMEMEMGEGDTAHPMN